jgi:1-acyl-sn-glycerol-3-phosphate acyltransferase
MKRRQKNLIARIVQILIFALILRPFVSIFMRLRIGHKDRLPKRGPAIIVANHNSHLDTLSLMAQMPLTKLWHVRPVAAADHFKKGFAGFVARHLLRSILIDRDGRKGSAVLGPILSALDAGDVIIFFPEGSRGEPEVFSRFKRGISYLAEARPSVPIVPVYLHNMGKCMPKGSMIFVPFICEMIVAEAVDLKTISSEALPKHLRNILEALSAHTPLGKWDAEPSHGLGDPLAP